jgi:hypothetical protein
MNKNIFFKKSEVFILLLLIGITINPSINGSPPDDHHEYYTMGNAFTQRGYHLTVQTDKNYYFPGEIVNFSGQFTEDGTGCKGRIQYTLIDPISGNIFGGLMFTEDTGFFHISYTLSDHANMGLYTFRVEYYYDTSIFATTSFEVTSHLRISNIRGGLGKIHAKITNLYSEDLHNVTWSIFVIPNGGFFAFEDNLTQGTIQLLKVNETVSIETSGGLLALGGIEVYMTAKGGGEEITRLYKGVMFFFLLLCRG